MNIKRNFSPSTVLLSSILLLSAALIVAGCAGNKPARNQIFLMPAPDVYDDGRIDPFIDNDPISRGLQPGILFATDRAPAEPGDKKYAHYTHRRGGALRLGLAQVKMGFDQSISWEEARRISLLKNRTDNYPLEVGEVNTFGVLDRTVSAMDDRSPISPEPGRRFAEAIDERLATSRSKDVYVYVHGYKVRFENPVLVASELWHFLGYNGAFIAYSWPTKSSMWAYLTDLDSSINSARNLRTLIVHIAENTTAERIHLVGYSMGTRLVARTLTDLGMYAYLIDQTEVREKLKLGNVLLIGSDVDRAILGGYLQDGSLRIVASLTLYQSSDDGALNLSRRLFGRARAGQIVDDLTLGPRSGQFFDKHPELRIIDVTDAEGGTSGSGHSYFRTSPWVSSDILMTLLYDLTPEERGLVLRDDLPIWTFPDDYVVRLRESLGRVNPALAADVPEDTPEDVPE